MKSTDAPELWRTTPLAPYASALAQLEETIFDADAPAEELVLRKTQVYEACGSPLGQSPLLQWMWWEFGQWSTVN